MKEIVLEIRDVSNGILKNVNLEVEKGDFFVILAPSGSGKSTLLNLIYGRSVFGSGEILVSGIDINSIKKQDKWRAENIGYIYEERNLIYTLTVYENIKLPMLGTKFDKSKRKEKILEALENVDLKEKENIYPIKLNIEEEQRVALARAIAIDPAVVLADEPTGKLPRVETETFIELMKEVNKKTGKTFVVASHDKRFKSAASKILKLSV